MSVRGIMYMSVRGIMYMSVRGIMYMSARGIMYMSVRGIMYMSVRGIDVASFLWFFNFILVLFREHGKKKISFNFTFFQTCILSFFLILTLSTIICKLLNLSSITYLMRQLDDLLLYDLHEICHLSSRHFLFTFSSNGITITRITWQI